jgi:hypothetical protein
MLPIFDLKTVFNTKFVGMFMIYFHNKFYIPVFGGSLVNNIKLKVKYVFHAVPFCCFTFKKPSKVAFLISVTVYHFRTLY